MKLRSGKIVCKQKNQKKVEPIAENKAQLIVEVHGNADKKQILNQEQVPIHEPIICGTSNDGYYGLRFFVSYHGKHEWLSSDQICKRNWGKYLTDFITERAKRDPGYIW